MNTWRIGLRMLRQDWHSGELYLLAIALVLTIAAVSGVGFFTDRLGRTMAQSGSELIAADLVISGTAPIPESYAQQAREHGLEVARTLEFRSVVMSDSGPQLVQVKAVDGAYPLRGELAIKRGPDAIAEPATHVPPDDEIWIEPRLTYLLETVIGESIGLGRSRLTIGALVHYEPDAGGAFLQLAPRVMIGLDALDATGLVTPASRVSYRLLVAGPRAGLERFAESVRADPPPNARLIDAADARPQFSSALEHATRFLNLATLVTVLVAGAAIGLASRRLVERQIDAVAIMRCLGAHRNVITRILVLRILVLGLVAGLIGCMLGFVAQQGLTRLAADWIGPQLVAPGLAPIALGLGTGLVTLLGFTLPPLLQLSRVSPLRALRRDLGLPRASAATATLAAGGALAVLILWQARDFDLAWRLLVGVGAALAALVGAVYALIALGRMLTPRTRGIWRLGLAGLTRRPARAVLQVSGFGVGVLALLLLAIVRVDLLRTWNEGLPADAPNHFLINIQPHEVAPLQAFIDDNRIPSSGIFPMIRGRLVAIDGKRIDPDDYEDPGARQLAEREFNLSFAERPQRDNRIVAGDWWDGPEAPPQYSVEAGIAETLGMKLGDTLTFAVEDHEVEARITSLREVNWESFNVNFFVISPPSLLGGEAATYITSLYLPDERDALAAALIRDFPSVTLYDVQAIIEQVRRIMDRGALAVEYVFAFSLIAGVLVMFAGIQTSLDERRIEHGVLRTFGTRRIQLMRSLAIEFMVAGLLAGLLASLFAELTGWLLARQLFGLSFDFNPWLWVSGVFGGALVIGVAGTLATYPLLVRPPLQTLRRA